MFTPSRAPFAPWRTFNPLASKHERLGKALLFGGLMIVINVVVVLYRTRHTVFDSGGATSNIDIAMTTAFLVALPLWVTMFCILCSRAGKAQDRAVRKWASQTHPDPLFLARMSVSEELEQSERDAAKSLLDRSNLHWRSQVLQNPLAAGSTSRVQVPPLPVSPKKENRIEGAIILLVSIVILSAMAFLFTRNFVLLGLMAPLYVALVIANDILAFRPQIERRKAWEHELLQRFSLEELVAFESGSGDTTEGRYIHRLLDNTNPGWTLTPARPLWKVACDC